MINELNRSVAGIIIVLGSPNDHRGNLSNIALERCSQALAEHRKNPDYAMLTTGGWGAHFNTTDKAHGYYVQQELVTRGIPESAFLPWVESSNSIEDAALARPVLEACAGAELIVVTSDFHAARAEYLFRREYPHRQIRMSASSTRVTRDELASLMEHERRALERLKNNA